MANQIYLLSSWQSLDFSLLLWQCFGHLREVPRVIEHGLDVDSFKMWNLDLLGSGRLDQFPFARCDITQEENAAVLVWGQQRAAIKSKESIDLLLRSKLGIESRCRDNWHRVAVLWTSACTFHLVLLMLQLWRIDFDKAGVINSPVPDEYTLRIPLPTERFHYAATATWDLWDFDKMRSTLADFQLQLCVAV